MAIKILYVILSGGQARRIGGKSKLLLDVGNDVQGDNMLVLDYVLKLIPSQILEQATADGAIMLNCNDTNDAPILVTAITDRLGKAIKCIVDMPKFTGQGPLAGILAGLDVAIEHNFDAIITLPSDTPFMPIDITAKLQEASDEGRKIVSAFSDGRVHPVISLVPIHYRDALYDYLASGNRKIQPFFEADDWQLVKFDLKQAGAHSYDPFININTEQDLQTARKIASALNKKFKKEEVVKPT